MFRRAASFPVQPRPHYSQPTGFRHAAKLDRRLRKAKRRWDRSLVARDPARWSSVPAPEHESCSCALQGGESRGGNRREAHTIAEGEKTHGLAIWAKHCDGRASDQSPAAGRRKWVYAGLIAGNAHAARRRVAARTRQPRRRQRFRQFTEIGEPWHESEEVNYVGGGGVQFNCLGGRDPAQAGDFV